MRTSPQSPNFLHPSEAACLTGTSALTERVRSQIARIGPYFRVALVTGETGAGKEVVARCLHQASQVSRELGGALIHCGTEELEAAAANVAGRSSGGLTDLVAQAHGGTLLLDEPGDLSVAAQAALTRLLEKLERQNGGAQCRVIAISRQNLKVLSATGAFRPDLYHRISAVEIHVAALRDRLDDIPALAIELLGELAPACGRELQEISGAAMERLKLQPWSGNIRELRNVLSRALMEGEGTTLEEEEILWALPRAEPIRVVPAPAAAVKATRLQDAIEEHVLRVLRECEGNKLRAADLLGISRSTLYRMLETTASAQRVA